TLRHVPACTRCCAGDCGPSCRKILEYRPSGFPGPGLCHRSCRPLLRPSPRPYNLYGRDAAVAGSETRRQFWNAVVLGGAGLAVAGCGATRPPPPPAPLVVASIPPAPAPPAYSQFGVASWYGPGFNGHATSSGEIYNQDDLTAASTLYALGSHVMVTNLDNGRSVEVRINDHGPYVKGRKI